MSTLLSQQLKRLLNAGATTLFNLLPTILSIAIPTLSGEQTVIFVAVANLTAAISLNQWEREGQSYDVNGLTQNLLLGGLATALYSALTIGATTSLRFYDAALVGAYSTLYANLQVTSASACAKRSMTNTFFSAAARVGPAVAIAGCLYAMEVNVFSYLVCGFAFATLIGLGLLRLNNGRMVIANRSTLSRSGLYIQLTDFLKNQVWILLFGGFASQLSIAQVYLIRQLLSPIATLLAAHRSAVFDLALVGKLDVRRAMRRLPSIYGTCGFVVFAAYAAFSLLAPGVLNTGAVVLAWFLLVLAQDYRAYFTRSSLIRAGSGLALWCLMAIPIIVAVILNRWAGGIDVGWLILAGAIGELAVAVLFRSTEMPTRAVESGAVHSR